MTRDAAADPPPSEEAGLSIDRFLGGRIVLAQPKRGHRAGLDAALLQAVVPADADGLLVDLGAGTGAVGLSALARAPALRALLVEREPAVVAALRQTLTLPENAALAPRARLVEADLALPRPAREAAGLADGAADWLLFNPPFFDEVAGDHHPSPSDLRRRAHSAPADPLPVFARAAAGLARSGARLALIHRADRLGSILAALGPRFGGLSVFPVFPRAGAAATRVLVAGVRGSRAPLALLPGLVLHRDDGAWTEETAAILDGRAAVPLFAEAPAGGRRRADVSGGGRQGSGRSPYMSRRMGMWPGTRA